MNSELKPSASRRRRSLRRALALRLGVALVALTSLLVFATTAMAQSASSNAYNSSTPFLPHPPTGGMPFTGLDVGVVILGGVLTLCVGVAIRRLSRRSG
jgi:hypothetical protein